MTCCHVCPFCFTSLYTQNLLTAENEIIILGVNPLSGPYAPFRHALLSIIVMASECAIFMSEKTSCSHYALVDAENVGCYQCY